MNTKIKSGELVKATYEFEDIPRFYRKEFYIWPEAMERWKKEGLPENIDERDYFMLDQPFAVGTWVNLGWCEPPFLPQYKEKVIKEEGDYEIIQDNAGRQLKVFKGKRHGFMPSYVKHPVEDKKEWEQDVKPRLKWDDKKRWTKFYNNFESVIEESNSQKKLIKQNIIGGYMYLRALMGPEDILYTFYDDPQLIHDMMKTWFKLMDNSLARIQSKLEIDQLDIGEDICYKSGLLISPDMFNQFLTPYYEKLIDNARKRQHKKIYVIIDTDGYAVDAIPLYQKVGANGMMPFEVASGCDVVEIGKKFPDLIIIGGIDKRVLAKNPEEIDQHLEYIIPNMLERGGYIPTCDHGVPDDVSLENYMYYRKRVCELGQR